MKKESQANFETRVHLQRIRNTWRVTYPHLTVYQIMKLLLKDYSKN